MFSMAPLELDDVLSFRLLSMLDYKEATCSSSSVTVRGDNKTNSTKNGVGVGLNSTANVTLPNVEDSRATIAPGLLLLTLPNSNKTKDRLPASNQQQYQYYAHEHRYLHPQALRRHVFVKKCPGASSLSEWVYDVAIDSEPRPFHEVDPWLSPVTVRLLNSGLCPL